MENNPMYCGYDPNITDLGGLLDDVVDVMTPHDVNDAIHRINLWRGQQSLKGPPLVHEVLLIAETVRSFAHPSFDGIPKEARWVAWGLHRITDGIVDVPQSTRGITREQLQASLVDSLRELEQDPGSPYTEAMTVEIRRVATAWLNASPYTVWRMCQDAWVESQAKTKELFFEFASGQNDLGSVQTALTQQFESAADKWCAEFLAKGKAA